jgi:hypothetical protein
MYNLSLDPFLRGKMAKNLERAVEPVSSAFHEE